MRTPTKFVEALTDEQKSCLQAMMKSNAPLAGEDAGARGFVKPSAIFD